MVEFVLLYGAIVLPLTFGIIFVAEMMWVWHSLADFTRDGARFAATHCWRPGGSNVLDYMRSHVPRMIDMDQFQTGSAELAIDYFKRSDAGVLEPFTDCDGAECSTACVADVVTVRVTAYEFRRFVGSLGLPPVRSPEFRAVASIESSGCDPADATCYADPR
jgi:hypothetical protein